MTYEILKIKYAYFTQGIKYLHSTSNICMHKANMTIYDHTKTYHYKQANCIYAGQQVKNLDAYK